MVRSVAVKSAENPRFLHSGALFYSGVNRSEVSRFFSSPRFSSLMDV